MSTESHFQVGDYEYCDAVDASPILELVAYWNGLRGHRFAPGRSEFDPAAVRLVLPYISMMEVLDGGRDFRFRLLGTRIVEGLGRDSTGRRFSEVYAGQPETMDRMLERMHRVMRLRQPVFTRGGCYWRPDRSYKSFQDVNLPFSSDGAQIDLVMGALVIQGLASS